MKHHRNQWNTFFAIEQQIPYETHLQNTKERSQMCRMSVPRRQSRPLSFHALVRKQIRFLAWKIWCFQGILLTALCAAFSCLFENGYQNWLITVVPKFLCCCSGIIVMSGIPLLRRSTRYRMLELERSTRFSIVGTLTSQLLFIAIGDLGMLALLALTVIRYGLAGRTAFLSLALPFMTAAAACLMLWVRTKPSFFERTAVPLCVLIVLLMNQLLDWYQTLECHIRMEYWGIYLFFCLCILYHEYRKLFLMECTERML